MDRPTDISQAKNHMVGLVEYIGSAAKDEDWIGVLQLVQPTLNNTGKVTLQWKVTDDEIIMKYGQLTSFLQSGRELLGEQAPLADHALRALSEARSQLLNRRDDVLNKVWKRLVTENAMAPPSRARDAQVAQSRRRTPPNVDYSMPQAMLAPAPANAPSLPTGEGPIASHALAELPPHALAEAPPRGSSRNGRFMAAATDKMLRADDADARWAALEQLKHGRGDAAMEHVEQAARLLHDQDDLVRLSAADMIGQLGEVAGGYAEDLAPLLASPNLELAKAAARALGHMARAAAPLAGQIAALLQSSDASTRVTAVQALGRLGIYAESTAAEVAKCLCESDSHLRYAAMESLWALGPDALVASTGAMVEALRSPDGQVRWVGGELLKRMGPGAAPATDQVVALLDGGGDEVRVAAVEVLAAVAGGQPSVAGRMVGLLQDPSTRVRWAAVKATRVWEAEQCREQGVAVVALLRDSEAGVRRAAGEVLGALLPALGPGDLKPLVGPCLDTDGDALRGILETLKRAAGKEATLQHAMATAKFAGGMSKHRDVIVRHLALEVLARLPGAAVAGVADDVGECLKDSDARVRAAAVTALEQTAAEEERFVGMLKSLVNDQDTIVRCAATNSLRRIASKASGDPYNLQQGSQYMDQRFMSPRAMGRMQLPSVDRPSTTGVQPVYMTLGRTIGGWS